jgi:hypothetical protein
MSTTESVVIIRFPQSSQAYQAANPRRGGDRDGERH